MKPSWKIAACIFLLAAFATWAAAADVSGKWSGTMAMVDAKGDPGQPDPVFLILKQTGTTLTGSSGPDQQQQWPIEKGKVDGNKITAEVTSPDGTFYVIVATVDGDRIIGGATVTGGGQSRKAVIDLKRLP